MPEKERGIYTSERVSTETREKRVERLRLAVFELFPGEEKQKLRENIERSFLVPQVGDYHNEGVFMESHLALILQNIENVAEGRFPEVISPAVREMLKRAGAQDLRAVQQYVFLHDIAKADCLTIKRGNDERATSWQEWIALLEQDHDGARALQGDEEAFRRFIERQGIAGVSYWQETPEGNRHHGDIGAKALSAEGIDANSPMLAAIEAHEVAYQFQRINAKTYESFFGGMSPEARDFALLASYVDTMASVRADGKPDLANFLALAGSREKYEALMVLADRLKDKKLDKQKFERAWAALRGSSEPLTVEMIEAVEEKIQRECKIAGYDIEKLQVALEVLVADATLSNEERVKLLELAATEPQSIGRVFGAKMRFLTPALKQAAI